MLSMWHILIVALLVILLFGRGKISDLMGDVAKGIKSFRKGMSDEEEIPRLKQSNDTATPETVNQDTVNKG